jgi:hypothetical protein
MSAPPSEPPAGPSTTTPVEKPTTSDATPSVPADTDGDIKMDEKPEEVNPYADIPEHVMSSDVETIKLQARLIENEVKVYI